MPENIINVNINDIYLDEKNPRLPMSVERTQDAMALYIARNTSITELMTAIAENNYFPGEPLVVVPRDEGGYWSVEGNRRLTALKLLRDPSIYPRNARVQEIAEAAAHRPEEVPCVVFDDRAQVVNYLGYRHISGVKQWEPLAKARYIAEYFRTLTDPNADPQERYKSVARSIGSQAPFIKRQLDGIAVYEHIEELDFYEIEGLDEESISFSLLTTALGYEAILGFVSKTPHPFVTPADLKDGEVKLLIEWLYKRNENGESTLGESRNIQRLAAVVADADALKLLKADRNLEKAFKKTEGLGVEFYDLLVGIEGGLKEAVGTVAIVDLDEGHTEKITDIAKQARALKKFSEDD